MSFLKRYGTEEIPFIAEVVLQKLVLNIKAPDMLVQIMLQRGEHKLTTKTPGLLSNRVALFQESLELPITLYYERKAKVYQEKIGVMYVLLQGARGIKKAGEVTIDFSEYAIHNQFFKPQVSPLEKCIDREATLQYTVVLTPKNGQMVPGMIKPPPIQEQKVEPRHVSISPNCDVDSPIRNLHEERSVSPRKKTGWVKPPPNTFAEHQQQDSDDMDNMSQIATKPIITTSNLKKPKSAMKSVGFKEDLSEGAPSFSQLPAQSQAPSMVSISLSFEEQDLVKSLKEDIKYQRIELGQMKHQLEQSKMKVFDLTEQLKASSEQLAALQDEKKKLERFFEVSQAQNKELLAQRAGGGGGDAMENKRLNELILRLNKEKNVLIQQLEEQQPATDFDWKPRESTAHLETRITELEAKLSQSSDTRMAKLSVENEQLKRKLQLMQETHEQAITRIHEETEEAITQALQSQAEEVEELRPYRDKYEAMYPQFRKVQADLEALRLLKYNADDRFDQLNNQYRALESQLLSIKEGVAGAMLEFLNYGDSNVIDIMEHFLA